MPVISDLIVCQIDPNVHLSSLQIKKDVFSARELHATKKIELVAWFIDSMVSHYGLCTDTMYCTFQAVII